MGTRSRLHVHELVCLLADQQTLHTGPLGFSLCIAMGAYFDTRSGHIPSVFEQLKGTVLCGFQNWRLYVQFCAAAHEILRQGFNEFHCEHLGTAPIPVCRIPAPQQEILGIVEGK